MKFIKNNKYVILILLVAIILFLRLFMTPRFYGHDTIFHTANIINLSKTISFKNILGSKIITFASNPFGYGTWLFYPKLPHLLGSYLYKIINNVYTSMNIVYFVITLLSSIVMYFLSKKIFNNKKIALISSIIYMTIPYHISEFYIRDAYAENFIFLAAPLIFLGLYYLRDGNKKYFYINFILGYVIGMYSHLVSMVFCTILVGIFILYYHKLFFTKDKIKTLVISALIVTGLCLPFLITVIEYKLLDTYTVFLSERFTNRFSVVSQVIELKGYYNQVARYDKIMTYFNISTIVLFILTTIQVIFKKSKVRGEQIFLLIVIFLLVTVISSKEIWNNIPSIFLMIQFPWRLLVFLSLFVSLYAPSVLLNDFSIGKNIKNIIFCLLVILILIEGLGNIDYYSNERLDEEDILESRIAMGYQLEYLPIQTSVNYFVKREYEIISSDSDVLVDIVCDDFPSLVFDVNNIDKNVSIELPRIYYLGYVLEDENGKKIELYNGENGFLKADISSDGEYTLSHHDTILEKIANFICCLTLVVVIIGMIRRCRDAR